MLRWLALLVVLAAGSCALTRDLEESSGAHPLEWSTAGSAEFHGRWLADNDYPLADCQRCHGRELTGGDVDVSCATAGCHPLGADACGNCHGQYDDPLPANLAHQWHEDYCTECHARPDEVEAAGHIDGTVDIEFTGAAVEEGRNPQWIATTRRCSDVSIACHSDSITNPWDGGAAESTHF